MRVREKPLAIHQQGEACHRFENYVTGSMFAPAYSGTAQYMGAYIDVEGLTSIFGHSDSESAAPETIENTIHGQRFFISGYNTYTTQSITARIICTGSSKLMKAAIYEDDLSDVTLVGTTEEKTVAIGTGWVTFSFASPQTLTHGFYVLVVWSASGDGDANLCGERTDGRPLDGRVLYAGTYGDWPDPVEPSFVNENSEFSIYCSITEQTKVKAAIYAADNTFIADTEEKTVLADGWVVFNFLSPPSVTAGTNYILVAWSDYGSRGDIKLAYATWISRSRLPRS